MSPTGCIFLPPPPQSESSCCLGGRGWHEAVGSASSLPPLSHPTFNQSPNLMIPLLRCLSTPIPTALDPRLVLMRRLPLSPNGSPCRHSCSLSSYSPCGCKGDPSKMQIQSHHASIKTFRRLPVNFRIKSQLHMMANKALQDPKAAYLPASLLPFLCCDECFSRTKGPKKTPGSGQLCVQTLDALLSLLAGKLHPLLSCKAQC